MYLPVAELVKMKGWLFTKSPGEEHTHITWYARSSKEGRLQRTIIRMRADAALLSSAV